MDLANINIEINNDAIDRTMIDLNNIIDNITTNLNSIDMIIFNMNDYFKGNNADEIKKKFDSYRDKYETYKDNLNTFVSDLAKVKNGLATVFSEQTAYLDKLSSQVEMQRIQDKMF